MNDDPEQPDARRQSGRFPDHQQHSKKPNDATNGRAHVGINAFGLYARLLLRNGYSPVPIEPGDKRPLGALGVGRTMTTITCRNRAGRISLKFPHEFSR
jgi:hypothetical protein